MLWLRTGWLVALLSLPALAQEPAPKKAATPDRAALEKRFTERMRNVTLVGHFTVDGQEDEELKEERYEVESVKKLKGDSWLWIVRIKYGKTDVKVPLTLDMVWAGDTPMVTLTDFEIPLVGGGAFTSRVLFYEDRYAGTWQHGDVGGHLFGTIEQSRPAEKPQPKDGQ